MEGCLGLIVGPAKALGDATRQPADCLASGRPHLVQRRTQYASTNGDAPQRAIGDVLCGPLDDVGVPGRGRPAPLDQVVLHRGIAQLPDDRTALVERPTEGTAHALRHAVLAIHPGQDRGCSSDPRQSIASWACSPGSVGSTQLRVTAV